MQDARPGQLCGIQTAQVAGAFLAIVVLDVVQYVAIFRLGRSVEIGNSVYYIGFATEELFHGVACLGMEPGAWQMLQTVQAQMLLVVV